MSCCVSHAWCVYASDAGTRHAYACRGGGGALVVEGVRAVTLGRSRRYAGGTVWARPGQLRWRRPRAAGLDASPWRAHLRASVAALFAFRRPRRRTLREQPLVQERGSSPLALCAAGGGGGNTALELSRMDEVCEVAGAHRRRADGETSSRCKRYSRLLAAVHVVDGGRVVVNTVIARTDAPRCSKLHASNSVQGPRPHGPQRQWPPAANDGRSHDRRLAETRPGP